MPKQFTGFLRDCSHSMAKSTAIRDQADQASPCSVKPAWFYCSCMVILHHVSPQFNPRRIWLWTALDLERLRYQTVPSGFQHRPAHNLGQCMCNSTCVCNIERLGRNKRLRKDGEFSAQSLTSHPSCHRREITCSRALDTAVAAEDNALNQLFTPIEGINYQVAGKQNSTLYS